MGEPNEKAATTGKTVTRARSDVAFPYYSLDKSIEVAKFIHERAGGRCDRAQLAALLGYNGVKNGGFLTRMSASKMFGLIEEAGSAITLTERAKKILSPVRPSDAEQAKLDAFLDVELFEKVFTDFHDHTLPGPDGLTNLFLTQYKIVPKQVSLALRNLMDSADSAGLFKVAGNRSKLIRPIIRDDGRVTPPPPAPSTRNSEDGSDQDAEDGMRAKHNPVRNADTKGPDLSGVHPALVGLIQNLPAVGATLGPKRRAALIDAFKHTINFVYPEEED
jgi:hypothetical protein